MESIMERIHADLVGSNVTIPSGDALSIDLSVGIARAEPQDTAESIIDRADADLYRIKRQRNGVVTSVS